MKRISFSFLLAAAALIAAGILRGESGTVWSTGINLCLVCVGIG